jgi:hypothetical protein
MFKSSIAAISLLTTLAVTVALAAPPTTDPRDPPKRVVSSSGRERWVIQNPNNCAPWLPMAVYAPGPGPSRILGYRCYFNGNG